MFGKLFKAAGKVASFAVPIAIATVHPEAMINTALGTMAKHGTKINNQALPVLNLLLSTGFSFARHGLTTGDWVGGISQAIQEGATLAMASTAIHQTVKIPLKSLTGRKL